MNKTNTTANQPVQTFRSGSVEGAVWMNETDAGTRYYSLTVNRNYAVEGKDGTQHWKRTQSFGSSDLLDLRRVIASVEAFIAEQPI